MIDYKKIQEAIQLCDGLDWGFSIDFCITSDIDDIQITLIDCRDNACAILKDLDDLLEKLRKLNGNDYEYNQKIYYLHGDQILEATVLNEFESSIHCLSPHGDLIFLKKEKVFKNKRDLIQNIFDFWGKKHQESIKDEFI